MINIPLKGMFVRKYGDKLKGTQNWLGTVVSKDDRQVLARRGFACSGYGVLGGLERARTAERDNRGRFK